MTFSAKRLVLAVLSIVAALLSACGASSGSSVKDLDPQDGDAVAAAAADSVNTFGAEAGYYATQILDVAPPATPTLPTESLLSSHAAVAPTHISVDVWLSPSRSQSAIRLHPSDGSAAEVAPGSSYQDYKRPEDLPPSLRERVRSKGLHFPVRVFTFKPKSVHGTAGLVTETPDTTETVTPDTSSQPPMFLEMLDCDPTTGFGCF